jgi:hypothetical protein
MTTSEGHPILGEGAILEVPGNYQPVHLEDTFGAIFLGVFAIITLIGWMRSEARYRKFVTHQEITDSQR